MNQIISSLSWRDIKKRKEAYTVKLILHVPVVIDETGHLFLLPVILLHQQLIHCTQLPIHSLQARGLLALLLPASANHKEAR